MRRRPGEERLQTQAGPCLELQRHPEPTLPETVQCQPPVGPRLHLLPGLENVLGQRTRQDVGIHPGDAKKTAQANVLADSFHHAAVHETIADVEGELTLKLESVEDGIARVLIKGEATEVRTLEGDLSQVPVAEGDATQVDTQDASETPISAEPSVNDFAWLAGSWRGEGLGGICEEIWSPALGGTMMGTFRLVKDDKVVFYEIMVLGSDKGMCLRVKHFSEAFVSWEEKADSVRFACKSVKANDAQ